MLWITLLYVVGIVFILLAIYLKFWRGKRKFYRRNQFGLETFETYEKSLYVSYWENFIQFIYIVLAIAGLLLLFTAFFGKDDILSYPSEKKAIEQRKHHKENAQPLPAEKVGR